LLFRYRDDLWAHYPREKKRRMNNYHVTRCESLINSASVSSDLRMIAEALVAMASGIDDADSMAQQALERIDIVAETVNAMEKRLAALEQSSSKNS
jgi:DNA repair ATPase RecN